jgi:hypothetical protein
MRRPSRPATRILLLVLVVGMVTAKDASARKVSIARKFRAGQSIAYVTKVDTNSKIDSNPPMLKNFFPAMPTAMHLNQQTTVTVKSVGADGSADVEQHFDKFEITLDPGTTSEGARSPLALAQQEVSQRLVGQSVVIHYNASGRVADFSDANGLFREIEGPVREPFLQVLRLSQGQMGGDSLYPDHRVKKGESWTRDLGADSARGNSLQVAGTSTMHFEGKTKYHGVKAAIIDYEFESTLTPSLEGLGAKAAIPQLGAMGIKLSIAIKAKGNGRVLVALNDGRMLQNHSSLHQAMSTSMQGGGGMASALAQAARIEIQSDTEMNVEGTDRPDLQASNP